MLCRLGLHRWQSRRLTYRAGTSVYVCRGCALRKTLHKNRRRIQKRYTLFGLIFVSVALWFAILNVARDGHTKILQTTSNVAVKLDQAASRSRKTIHKVEGDTGSYVDGPER